MTYLFMGEGDPRPHVPELVINWHLTEACNYKCQYCYAKWDSNDKELIHDWDRTRKMLDELMTFFHPGNDANPLQKSMRWSGVRLNLAGGEPLLYPDAVLRVLAYAKAVGMSTSIITNGSRFTPELMNQLAQQVSMLGISIDSANATTNREIGRIDNQGRTKSWQEVAALMQQAKQLNPELAIKINTVVNALNAHEDLSEPITALAPDRWKVFRMLPVVTDDLAISPEEFARFVRRHHRHADVMCAEDNNEMSESYLMIDPLGRFFQNTKGQKGYNYSRPIDTVGAKQAFRDWRFAVTSFTSRYPAHAIEAIQ